MNDICHPSDNNGWFISENNLFAKDSVLRDDILWDDVLDIAMGVWECHTCGRLAFDNNDNDLKWYLPVDGKNGNLTL